MSGVPEHILEDIQSHLDAIARHFIRPRVTLLVRPDVGPGLDADFVLTNDDLLEAADGLIHRHETALS